MSNVRPTHWQQLRNAASATLLVYIVKTSFAYCIADPVSKILEKPPLDSAMFPLLSFEDRYWPALFESFRSGWPLIKSYGLLYLAICIVYFLLTPFISMLWLCALSQSKPLRSSVLDATTRYHRGLSVFCLFSAFMLFIAALPVLVHASIQLAQFFVYNDRTHDLTILFAYLLVTPLIIFLFMLSDSSMAALTTAGVGISKSIRLGFYAIYRRDRVLAFLGWHTCSVVLMIAGLSLMCFVPFSDSHYASVAFCVSQALVFCRTILRGRWLASLV
jgi:hypothetical protein